MALSPPEGDRSIGDLDRHHSGFRRGAVSLPLRPMALDNAQLFIIGFVFAKIDGV
jgi:hypothetical protein